jgi:hypothetical protein
MEIRCDPVDGGWACVIRVGGDPGATFHHVAVSADDLYRYAPNGVTAERLVEASFTFLLERETRESILREFDLPEIGGYFPEYETEIRRRLGG